MYGTSGNRRFWWHWIAANSIAEFIGLGSVAAVGYAVIALLGEPRGLEAVIFAAIFVVLGAVEGLVVGSAQSWVLKERLPNLQGWVGATVFGAVVAWILGMLPSTIMAMVESGAQEPPPEIGEGVRLLFAAALGLVAGPVLAFFQWRRLRRYVSRNALWWLPANAAAWALGMPVVFVGTHVGATASGSTEIIFAVGLALLAAGAVVGAVHGRVLIWLLAQNQKEDLK